MTNKTKQTGKKSTETFQMAEQWRDFAEWFIEESGHCSGIEFSDAVQEFNDRDKFEDNSIKTERN